MNETTPLTDQEKSFLQELVDAWDARPRRQLDYSGLNESSLQDLEWTNRFIKSAIPAIRIIESKFGIVVTPPITMAVSGLNLRSAALVPPVDTSATPEAQNAPQAASSPNTSPSRAPKTKRSTRTQAEKPKKAGTVSKSNRKPGKKGKSSSDVATPASAPATAEAAPTSSTPPPETKKDGANLADPPPPKLETIG